MTKKNLSRFVGSFCAVLMIASVLLMVDWAMRTPAQVAAQEIPDKIRIGCAIALSGPNAMGAENSGVSLYKLWAEQTNAKGGIFVPKYNKRIPVELIIYDDHSDIETCVKMVEKLILEDKVDFMLPPWGTASNFAVAPVANKYGHIMMGITVSSPKLAEKLATTPYFFVILAQPPLLVKSTVELMKEFGVKSVAIIYVSDLFGLEHAEVIKPLIAQTDIKVPIFKSFPIAPPDMSPMIKRIMDANVDGVISYGYPPSTFLLTKQMTALGYNPKFFQNGVGTQFIPYRDAFGAAGVEGVIGQWACNPKVPAPGLKEFYESYKKRWGKECARAEEPGAYASLQIFEQAIQKVGDLDRAKIRDVVATDTFTTIMGPIKFVDGLNIYHPGELGQWQSGEYEVIAPKKNRTSDPIYPKPKWPEKK